MCCRRLCQKQSLISTNFKYLFALTENFVYPNLGYYINILQLRECLWDNHPCPKGCCLLIKLENGEGQKSSRLSGTDTEQCRRNDGSRGKGFTMTWEYFIHLVSLLDGKWVGEGKLNSEMRVSIWLGGIGSLALCGPRTINTFLTFHRKRENGKSIIAWF